jgi:hypothetical protein
MAHPRPLRREGWGVEALISALVVFAIEVVSLFFSRALFVWFYNSTGSRVLLARSSTPASMSQISQLSRDVVPASNTVRFLIFTAVIVLFATAVIIATKCRLGRHADGARTAASDTAGEHTPDDAEGRESDPRDA